MSEPVADPPRRPAPAPDVRVGSTPNALEPISVAERSLAAGLRQWLALGLVAVAAIAADQATKQLVGRQLELGEETAALGPFSIHHVQNSGIAFGFFPTATTIVIALTGLADGVDARRSSRAPARATRCCRSGSGSSSAGASRTSSTASGSGT